MKRKKSASTPPTDEKNFQSIWPNKVQKGEKPAGLHGKHHRSDRLERDGRLAFPPRHHEVAVQNASYVVSLRIYPGPEATLGAELLTVSLLEKNGGQEFESRFDEIYPIWVTFKKEDDSTRCQKAKSQIERTGGVDGLVRALKR